MAYIEMVHSFKRYHMGDIIITANNDVSFGIERGELAIILGSSGAGKSTVLNILGGMDTNSEGKVIIDGVDISDFNAKQLTDYRRNNIGFVFQFYNLVANLTAKENVELASELVKNAADPVQTLVDVGLGGRGPAGHGASATGLGLELGLGPYGISLGLQRLFARLDSRLTLGCDGGILCNRRAVMSVVMHRLFRVAGC